MPQNIGVFIDRDGTISEEVGYVNHVSRYQVYPWTAEAIRNLNEAGLKVIVVTNQAGVARGYFKEELVKQVHEKLVTEMTRAGARFADAHLRTAGAGRTAAHAHPPGDRDRALAGAPVRARDGRRRGGRAHRPGRVDLPLDARTW